MYLDAKPLNIELLIILHLRKYVIKKYDNFALRKYRTFEPTVIIELIFNFVNFIYYLVVAKMPFVIYWKMVNFC